MGDQKPVGYINADNYTQHILGVEGGPPGFGKFLAIMLPKGVEAEVIRAGEDGDQVFLHV